MPKRVGWSRNQLIIALKLYCEMPFGKMHSRNPDVIRYAKLINRTPSALAMKLTNFASLDPKIRSTGRKGLSGASDADRQIWREMTENWAHLAAEIESADGFVDVTDSSHHEQQDNSETTPNFLGMTREALIQARVGQSFFRSAVLSAYDFKCCITGLTVPELLVASHIVPWRSDCNNRLNPKNGLCLSALHDRAFDAGLLTISDAFTVVISKRLRRKTVDAFLTEALIRFEGKPINLPEKFAPDPVFLTHHRKHVFAD
jgi:putative restriction endonuclease